MAINDRVIIPTLSIQDQSLHPTDRQVLYALCVYVDPSTHIVAADRKTIGSLIGLHESKVSQATARLELAGWLLKEGQGRGVKYHINWTHQPATLPDSGSDRTEQTGLTLPNSGSDRTEQTGLTLPNSGSVQSVASVPTVPTLPNSGSDKPPQHHLSLPDSGSVEGTNKNQVSTIRTEDQKIRSEDLIINNLIFRQERAHDVVTFDQAISMLDQVGCKYSIKDSNDDKNARIIHQWINEGVTIELLVAAMKRADVSETRQAPIGPKYVCGCINTIRNQRNKTDKIYIPPVSDEKELNKMATEYGVGTAGVPSYHALRSLIEDAVRRKEQAAA